QQIDDVLEDQRLCAQNDLRRAKIETAGKHAQPIEERLFPFLEKIVRPGHERTQRLLALECDPAAASEQLEAIVQALIDLTDRQGPHASCRQLQRERNAVKPRAKVGNRRRVALGQRESRLLKP